MKAKQKWLLQLSVFVVAVLLLIFLKRPADTVIGVPIDSLEAYENKLATTHDYEVDPYYSEVLKEWEKQGVKKAAQSITIDASQPAAVSEERYTEVGTYEGKPDTLIWNSTEEGWVEYQVEVPESALYEIHVTYNPLKNVGRQGPVQWNVTIDGKTPFREATSIALYRKWKDIRPILTNFDGDQIRPRSVDTSEWSTKPLIDSGGAYSQPLLWHFPKGVHTIRFAGYDPVAIASIELVPGDSVKTYEEVSSVYVQEKQPTSTKAEVITIQAEDFAYKNDTSIKLFSDKNSCTVPRYKGRILYNTIGGIRWVEQNQEITWEFEVPEDGLYRIGFRALQNTIAQKTSFRIIRIDGKVPFDSFQAYGFPYATGWYGHILQDENKNPYLIKLQKGKHSLSLAVTQSKVKPVVVWVENLLYHLDSIDWDLRTITGSDSEKTNDRNRTWNMDQDFPGLTDRMRIGAEAMEALSRALIQINGNKDSISQGLETSAKDLRELLKKPEEIPYHIDEISSMREKFGTYIDTLLKQSLQLDEIYIIPEQAKNPKMVASAAKNIWGSAENFIYSFDTRDSLKNLDDKKLNIWVQRGRDYVDQLQQLADEQFTPETGIEVKVNLLPNPELLLMSNASGVQPDIALGLTQDLPVDYAVRGSLHDLSKFDDFDQFYDTFSPGSWLALHYNGGYYGVPETQSFQVLYYRKDIMERLGLEIPETMEDVYEILPTLQQNFMNFYVNPKEFTYYFYQNGVEFYEPGGLRTGLDTPAAYKSFKQWSDLFNTYALEKEVPSFYQHFRAGTMPLGISDYNMYVRLSAAAPELNGRWGIALIPGTKQKDGSIVRWAGGGQRTGVIFEKSRKKDEAWKFLKWWLSTETQVQYGMDLEAINGVAFRWNTSNIEAFINLPWKKEDAEVILKQWKWYKDIPNVPGGYYLTRELNNAWVRSVVRTTNYMSSLEEAVRDIDRELLRKQQEFGFVDSSGKQIKQLDIPIVDRPWERVDHYVE